MVNVILTIHLLIAIGLVALILMQKTEGNASGGGFSQSSVTSMQPRPRPNAISRATTILGICFFVTSIGLALIAKNSAPTSSIIDAPASAAKDAPKVTDILPPVESTPAETAPAQTSPAETPAPAAPTVPNQ